MKRIYSQRLEMQISKENNFTSPTIAKNFDDEFNDLSKHYTLENSYEIKNFIKKHEKILGFIHEITPLINEYFPNYEKLIEFCKDPEFKDLDFVMIYIKGVNYEKDSQTLDKLEKEPLYMSKFSKKINGLVSMEIW